MYLMIRTFEERWKVEYLSGVTNEVVELVSVSSIHLRKRAEIPEPPLIRTWYYYRLGFTLLTSAPTSQMGSDHRGCHTTAGDGEAAVVNQRQRKAGNQVPNDTRSKLLLALEFKYHLNQ
jgi:hypothetical protein